MVIKIKLNDLQELLDICLCVEYCLKDDKVKPDEREKIKEVAEKLRNYYEKGKEIERGLNK